MTWIQICEERHRTGLRYLLLKMAVQPIFNCSNLFRPIVLISFVRPVQAMNFFFALPLPHTSEFQSSQPMVRPATPFALLQFISWSLWSLSLVSKSAPLHWCLSLVCRLRAPCAKRRSKSSFYCSTPGPSWPSSAVMLIAWLYVVFSWVCSLEMLSLLWLVGAAHSKHWWWFVYPWLQPLIRPPNQRPSLFVNLLVTGF